MVQDADTRASGGGIGWIVGLSLVMGVVFLVGWAAREGAKSSDEADRLAMSLAGLRGDQRCLLAWTKARDMHLREGDTPGGHDPEVLLPGPPLVIACEMITTGGRVVEPLRVYVRCNRLDLACVDLMDPSADISAAR